MKFSSYHCDRCGHRSGDCPCTRCNAHRRALARHNERPELAYLLERRLVDLFKQGSSMAELADEHGLKVADVEAAIRESARWRR